MEILSMQTLHGPNVWAKVPVLEARIAFGPGPYPGPDVLDALHRRLGDWLPGLAVQWQTRSSGAGGESPCHVLAGALLDVALHLQCLSVGLANSLLNLVLPSQIQTREPPGLGVVGRFESPAVCSVAVAYEEERFGQVCLQAACLFCEAALSGAEFDAKAELCRLGALAEEMCLGNVSAALVAAARARGIPVRRLDRESLVQLGWGAKQQRIRKAITSRTGKIADWISCNKQFTKTLLHELGIPVPAGRMVEDAGDAWQAACEIGVPVVVKPVDSDNTYGVSLKLNERREVLGAYAAAREHGEQVIVERFVPGEQYRVLVVGNRVVAANRREPPRVAGDGQHSIRELIASANRDPGRSDDNDDHLWWFIAVDDDTLQLLAEQGFDLDSVPPAGLEVVLGRIGHVTAGARVFDVTESVHPQVAEQCVSAARLLGLDVAGLDVIAQDISLPLEDQGGTILEVNAEPWLVFHLLPPYCDPPRPVCEAIIESLFPDGQNGRIPLAAVTGFGDNEACGRWLAQLLRDDGRRTGRASSAGLYLDDRRLKHGDQANLAGCRAILLHPAVEAAVLELSLRSVRGEGLGWDRCDVAVVTGRGAKDPYAERSGEDPEPAQAIRVVADAALPRGTVVIDAVDPAAAELAASFPEAVILVSALPAHPLTAADPRPRHRTVSLRGSDIVLAEHGRKAQLIPLDQGYLAVAGDPGRMSALLAAVAAAWAMGVPAGAIRDRLKALVAG